MQYVKEYKCELRGYTRLAGLGAQLRRRRGKEVLRPQEPKAVS